MYRKLAICTLLPLILVSAACRKETPPVWKPVLENSDFQYLKDAHARVRAALETARQALSRKDETTAANALQQTSNQLARLEQNYLPITEVRQLIYDADRLYFLNRKDEAGQKLRQAKEILKTIGQKTGAPTSESVRRVVVMIDDLLGAMTVSQDDVPPKLKYLGEKINLMALRGELVLAGSSL